MCADVVLFSGLYKIKDVGDVFAGKEADLWPKHAASVHREGLSQWKCSISASIRLDVGDVFAGKEDVLAHTHRVQSVCRESSPQWKCTISVSIRRRLAQEAISRLTVCTELRQCDAYDKKMHSQLLVNSTTYAWRRLALGGSHTSRSLQDSS